MIEHTYESRTIATRAARRRGVGYGAAFASALLISTALTAPANAATRTWSGSSSTDWFTAGNWSTSTVPTSSDAALIDTITNAPVISGSAAVATALVVGSSATGALTIENGGSLTNSGAAYIGRYAGAAGTVTVTGSASAWTANGIVYLGYSGTGTLTIANGGAVSLASALYVGNNAGSAGTVLVESGAALATAGSTYIGYSSDSTGAVTLAGVLKVPTAALRQRRWCCAPTH